MQALRLDPRKLKTWLWRAIAASAFAVPIVVANLSPAGFSLQDARLHVEIDGVNYGVFDQVDGLGGRRADGEGDDQSAGATDALHKITFRRDFVTDPSLYLWAKNMSHGRSELKDVHVVVENADGETVSRYVLKMCQPLSWTVEAANPALGGFHEKIEMAVQDIAVF